MHLGESFSRRLVAADATDLENFVHHLVSLRVSEYVGHARHGKKGDRGRDVVGFLTERKHEGPWHNFQCKHYARPLSEPVVLGEIGKIIYHASRGHFTLPTRYVFVAPVNVSASARDLLDKPSMLKERILNEWETACASAVSKPAPPMDDDLKLAIDRYDFGSIDVWDNATILTLPETPYAAAKIFGDDPGDAPLGTVPGDVDSASEHYSEQLRMVYSEHDGTAYVDIRAVQAHPDHGPDLKMHRQRYFDALEFDRYFRIRVGEDRVEEFRNNMRAVVHEAYSSGTGLARVRSVMTTAASGNVGGLFGRHQRVSTLVRQGTCHVFASEGSMPWWKGK